MDSTNTTESLHQVLIQASSVLSNSLPSPLPSLSTLHSSSSSLLSSLPSIGHGLSQTTHHLLHDVAPGLNASCLSPNYYGFVTGGVTPAARVADSLVSLYDQNVQVHLPEESVATVVEDRALRMLLELFGLDVEDEWNEGSKTFTTGATASNVLGLACGREGVLRWALRRDGDVSGKGEDSVGQLGILDACRRAGIERLQVLTTMPHSSIRKAAAVVGLGRAAVVDCGDGDNGLAFDWQKLSVMLECERSASLVVVSCGEVNTGGFATHSYEEMQRLRELCDKHGAWLHVDGAFGIFARTLKGIPEFERVASGAVGIELADSIAGDAHKLLNVPYDCGFFFCRHPQLVQQVFQNPNAAYLSTGNNKADSIGSPLNVGIENSRRFRGLPVYATLTAYGRDGYRDMLIRQVRFARAVAAYLRDSQELELLPQSPKEDTCGLEKIFIIVIFKAKDAGLNSQLVKRINTSNKVYVSGTIWDGEPASRIAVSNWQVERARDMDIVRMVLQNVLHEWRAETMNKEKTG